MPTLTLYQLSLNMAVRNISHIQDFGDMPWTLAKPVLKKVTSPFQLYKIELNSPQYVEDDEELWLSFIKRDFPEYQLGKDFQPPSDGISWYLVYFGIHEKEKKKFREQEVELKKRLQDRAESQSEVAFVRKILPQPREPPPPNRYGRGYDSKSFPPQTGRLLQQALPTRSTAKNGSETIAALRRESAKRSKNLAPTFQQRQAVNARQLQHRMDQNAKQATQTPAQTPAQNLAQTATPKAVQRTSKPAKSMKQRESKAVDVSEQTCAQTVSGEIGQRYYFGYKPLGKRNTSADLKKQAKAVDNAVQYCLSEREAELEAIKANAVSRPATPEPPSPKIHIPDELPFRAVITTTSGPTGEEQSTPQFEENLPPATPALQSRITIQKRRAPVNPFMPNKKRMT